MNIVLASDDNFVQHCGVAMLSVLQHNSGVRFFLLTEGITPQNECLLKELVNENGGELTICLVPSDIVKYFPMPKLASSHISIATYYRLFITSLLPEDIQKVIYLDCDMVVRGSLLDLWNMDLLDNALAAVYQNFAWSDHNDSWSRLNVPRSYGYFNAGMLVMNLRYLRSIGFQEMAIKYINENFNNIISHDQDVLNALFYEKTVSVSCKWNYLSLFLAKNLSDSDFPSRCAYVSEINQTSFDPEIVHFVSKPKPWHYGCTNPYTSEYYQVLQDTPWRDYQPKFVWSQYKSYVLIPNLKLFIKRFDIFNITEEVHKRIIRKHQN